LVRGVAEDHLARPFGELDLAHELGVHIDRAARGLGAAAERRGLAAERGQALLEVVEVTLLEPGADASAVAEVPLGVVVADEQCADPALALALPRDPAAAHDLLAARVLDLHSGAASSSGLVDAVHALR